MIRRSPYRTLAWALLPSVLLAGCGQVAGGPSTSIPGGGGGAPATSPASQMVVIDKDPTSFPPATATSGWTAMDQVDPSTPTLPFSDPLAGQDPDGAPYFVGKWSLSDGLVQQGASFASTRLSLQQYTGSAFGSGGSLPAHYRVDGTVWQYHYEGFDPNGGMGILAIVPYYLDSTHFVIVEASKDTASCWVDDGYLPGQAWPASAEVWSMTLPEALGIGDAITWSLTVDGTAHTVGVGLDGKAVGTLTIPMVDGSKPHAVCLASNGNPIRVKGFVLYGDGSSQPPAGTIAQPTPAPSQPPAATPTPAPVATPTPMPTPTPTPTPMATATPVPPATASD